MMTDRDATPTDTRSGRAPKVLILTASVGTGHNQAARAIEAGLAERHPAIEAGLAERHPAIDVEVRDVLDFAGTYFRLKYANGYTLAVTRFPWFYGVGFALTDRPNGLGRTLSERWKLLRERRAMGRLFDYARDTQPDLILHTHMLAPPLLGRAMQRGDLPSIPQWVQVTDIYPHRWWYAEHVDRWFLPQDVAADRLAQWGIEADRRVVRGIPIMPKWNRPLPEDADLRRQLRLPAEGPIILLSGGAEFTCGPVLKMTRGLAEAIPKACVVALAGRNKSLLAKFGALAGRYAGRIVPMGFTDRMHELSQVASLLVTKPGGIITSESLAKGTPMLFVRPVPGQEAHNAAFLVDRGAGVVARRCGEAVDIARTLLADPERLAAMSATASSLYRPARQTMVEAIRRRLLAERPAPAAV
ncbi:MAG: hypothetical protein GVY16_06045 [Planctomycetes bacterium]|jgi:processive 1,2-diacylglycerol beta-glucosyltransferase|nr:hypothetical protein [Planctomycetota bacterium]